MKRLLSIQWFRYLLYTLAVLPLFLLRDFSLNNELRYLSIADEALRNGSVFTFYNHGVIYADKPPLYLWIVMLGKSIFGFHSMLFLGIFSFLPALAILCLMDRWTRSWLSEKQRLTGELILLTSAFFIGTAIVLRMDMLMCLFIVLALYIFFKWHTGQGKPGYSILFPLCIFLALFTKGPIGLIVPLVSTTVFLFIKKQINTIGRYWGLKSWAILLALCAIWFTSVYAEGGKQYFNDLLFNQTINRAVSSFHHSEPFYYYLLVIWYALVPWSFLLIGILAYGIGKKLATGDLELFFLVIVLSTFVTLSLFSSKLAVYLLPCFPFMVYLSVFWIPKLAHLPWVSWLILLPAALLSLSLPAMAVLHYFSLPVPAFTLLTALILSATGIFTLWWLKKKQLNQAIIAMGTGLLAGIFILSFATPAYNPMFGLSQLTKEAMQHPVQNGGPHYYYCKISRADNLDVYLGQQPQKLRIKDLYNKSLSIQKPAILFLSSSYVQKNDSLRKWIQGKEKYGKGEYFFVEME